MSMQSVIPPPSQSSAEAITPACGGVDAKPFVHASPSSRKLVLQAELVAPHMRLATIEGEPGVGKHTLAGFLYERASAANACLARYGFRRCDAREWLLAQTDPQSITGFTYLDRLDLLTPPGQELLLRILKTLDAGTARAPIFVASSESSLRDLAVRGLFLSGLAFRLTAIRFKLPPLRERREDILPLATLFLDHIGHRYHMPRLLLATGAISLLLQHDWPGNVRELSSVLESAVLECTNGIIREQDLCLRSASASVNRTLNPPSTLNLDAVIQNHLRYVLELNHGNKLRTARQLGISRSTLYRLLGGGESGSN